MPTSIEALSIIALAITPGYLCLWCARQAIRQVSKQSDVELVISTVAVGVIVNGLVFPFLGRHILRHYRAGSVLDHPWLLFVWGMLTVVAVPVLLGLSIGVLINRYPHFFAPLGLDPVGRMPHAWDFAMRRKEGYYIRAWLTDGPLVAGKFSIGSFASSDPARSDLFMEEVWFVDDDGYFLAPVPDSGGVWIAASSISRLEFTQVRGGINEREQPAAAGKAGPADRGQAWIPADHSDHGAPPA